MATASELTALTAELNEYAQAQEEFGGQTITVRPEDVTLFSGGSLTDANGNVFTLQHMTGDFTNSGQLSDVYENGRLLESGETLGGGFWVALRLVDGVVLAENGKGIGWFGPDRGGAADPGPGDNAGDPTPPVVADETPVVDDAEPPVVTDETPVVDDETPVVADDETPLVTEDDVPVVAAEDTPSAETEDVPPADDTVTNLCDTTYHHYEFRMNCVSTDTTSHAAATATGVDLAASIADTATKIVADITAAVAACVPTDADVQQIAAIDDPSFCAPALDTSLPKHAVDWHKGSEGCDS